MGLLVEGKWKDQWYDTKSTGGKFERQLSAFRGWVRADGSTPHAPEAGRYLLYVSLACPWAHRTLIYRALKGLESAIDVSIVDPVMLENGWEFKKTKGSIPDPIHKAKYLHQIYTKADEEYTGRVTVPVLWDKKENTIVNNESSEIIRMLNKEFNDIAENKKDFYPPHLQDKIDEVNAYVYDNINNGVYRCGFATTQPAYEEAFHHLFTALDYVEEMLEGVDYLIENTFTEADIRLFTTLIRFDAVYVGHFKCNKKRIADYPNLSRYLKYIYNHNGITETVNFEHIKRHYYVSHKTINPTGVVPVGPELDLEN